MKLIAHLIIIWDLTMGRIFPITYSEYCDVKDKQYEDIINDLRDHLDLPSSQSVPPPVTSSQPPPYSKISLVVQRYKQDSEDVLSYHERRTPSKSSKHTYRTIAPEPVDSFGIPVASVCAASVSRSAHSRTSRHSTRKPMKEEKVDYDWYDDVSMTSEDIRGGPKLAKPSPSVSSSSVNDRRN